MYFLKAHGEEIICDKVLKGYECIKVYANDQVIAEYNGISDFSGYNLTDEVGNPVEFSKPEPTAEERQAAIERAIMEMAGEIYG